MGGLVWTDRDAEAAYQISKHFFRTVQGYRVTYFLQKYDSQHEFLEI